MVMPLAAALEESTALGPYFTLPHGERTADAGEFRPLRELYAERAALARQLRRTAALTGTEELRVAASTVQLGTLARLWSVGLACAALAGQVPDLSPGRLQWRAPGGRLELWLPEARALPVPEGLADALRTTVVAAHGRPPSDALGRAFVLSAHVQRGNTASALVGALRVLLRHHPHTRDPVLPLTAALLSRPPLDGAGDLHTDPGGDIVFRRRNCCQSDRSPSAPRRSVLPRPLRCSALTARRTPALSRCRPDPTAVPVKVASATARTGGLPPGVSVSGRIWGTPPTPGAASPPGRFTRICAGRTRTPPRSPDSRCPDRSNQATGRASRKDAWAPRHCRDRPPRTPPAIDSALNDP